MSPAPQNLATGPAREPVRPSCTSVYATPHDGGRRGIRLFSGSDGLQRFGAQARTAQEHDCFRARIVASRYGTVDLGIVQHTPHLMHHNGTDFGHNHPVSRLVVMIEGHETVQIGERTLTLGPGTGVLVPGHIPVTYEADEAITRLHLDVPVDDPTFSAHLDGFPLASWPKPSPALECLAAFGLTLLRRDDSRASWSERAEAQRVLEALAITTLASAPPVDDDEGADRSAHSVALEYIRTHHTDPMLTPTAVARGVGVSVRTLQRAFKDERGVAQWIAHFRVEHALMFLRDERFVTLTIPQIAARAGFGSTICMRRSVAAVTGHCPTEYRELHLGVAATPHERAIAV